MTLESSAWSAARRVLALYGRLVRVENLLEKGTPDVAYVLLGVAGWMETKATPATLKLEQVLWGEEWSRAGGLWHLLLRRSRPATARRAREDAWGLYDAAGARLMLERKVSLERDARAWIVGSLTPAPLLAVLAPPALRRRATTATSAA